MQAELGIKYTAVAWVCLWKRSVSVPPEAPVLLNLTLAFGSFSSLSSFRLLPVLRRDVSQIAGEDHSLGSDSRKCFIWWAQSLKTFKPTFTNLETFTQKPRLPISFEKGQELVANCCVATEAEAGSSCLSTLTCPRLLPHAAHSLRN